MRHHESLDYNILDIKCIKPNIHRQTKRNEFISNQTPCLDGIKILRIKYIKQYKILKIDNL